MRSSKLVVTIILGCVLVLGVGCQSGSTDQPAAAETTQDAANDAGSMADAGEAAEAASADLSSVGAEVQLAGTLGCGHCSFTKGDRCSAAVQTADGDIVILDVADDHELYAERFSGRAVTVDGAVAKLADDGTPHVEVSTYELGT
jgi:hypothetical protein